MNKMIALIALAGVACAASAGSPVLVSQFQLNDHPAGGENPPPYGLRLDNILGAGVSTLSIDFHNNTLLSVYDDGGNLSVNISGTLYGGVVDGMGGYVSAESYDIDFTYMIGVSNVGNGWDVNGFSASNSGTLTNTNTMAVTTLYGLTNNLGLNFAFLSDGHRLDGDNTSWVGRGWITDDSNGVAVEGIQDWLFIGTPVPAPGSIALMGLGGLVATRRRR